MAAPSHKILSSKAQSAGSAFKFFVKTSLGINLLIYLGLIYRFGAKFSNWTLAFDDIWNGTLVDSFVSGGIPAFPWEIVFSAENFQYYFFYPLPISLAITTLLLFVSGRASKTKFRRDYKLLSVSEYNSDLKVWKKRADEKFKIVSQKKTFRELNEIGQGTREYRRKLIFENPLIIDSQEGEAIIPHAMYRTHIGVTGITQTGKSTLIRNFLAQIRELGQSAVIVDYNGDYYKKFATEDDIVLCPFIEGSDAHDMHHEPVLADYLARSLVEHESRHNQYFSDWGIALLADFISMSQDYEELDELVRLDFSAMKPLLASKNSMAESVFESDKTASSVVSTMQRNLKIMSHLNRFTRTREKPLSLVEWAKNCHRNWIFIVIPEEYQETLMPWARMWLDLIVTGAMKREQRPNFHTFLIGDEINRLGYIPSLATSITNLAKYGLSSIFGFQSDSQLRQIYQEKSEEILINFNTRVLFNPGKLKTALENAADILGSEEIQEVATSQTLSDKSSHTTSDKEKEKHIVAMNELSRLEELECYLKASFLRPIRLTVKPQKIPSTERNLQIRVPTELLTGYTQTQGNPLELQQIK